MSVILIIFLHNSKFHFYRNILIAFLWILLLNEIKISLFDVKCNTRKINEY